MNKKRLLIFSTIIFLFLSMACASFLSSPSGPGRTTAASRSNCGTWSVVSSPNPGSADNNFNSVVALSAGDVWAVGNLWKSSTGSSRTLTAHWNGTSWRTASSPNVGSSDNYLFSVTDVSASNIWAVGNYHNSSANTYQTLIEQWNGRKWSVVSSPNIDHFNTLNSVIAISSNNIWAVGNSSSAPNATHHTLILHYDGSSWRVVSSPNNGSASSQLGGMTAVSANNVWAVGSYGDSKTGNTQTLTEQWNGSTWRIVKSQNVQATNNGLSSVTATTAQDIWAVGSTFDFASDSGQTLIEHYNGSTWRIIKSLNSGNDNHLLGVTAISSKVVWAVGVFFNGSGGKTLIEQWNGSTWRIVSSPNPHAAFNLLAGVAHDPSSSQVWAVGATGTNPGKTLTEFFC
jgi:hypothetical protein